VRVRGRVCKCEWVSAAYRERDNKAAVECARVSESNHVLCDEERVKLGVLEHRSDAPRVLRRRVEDVQRGKLRLLENRVRGLCEVRV
jgi:hypothetical protein